MYKGGYQIIDLGGYALTSGEEANISGTYDRISGANGKRVEVHGLTVEEVEYLAFTAYFEAGENIYTSTVTLGEATITITIAEGDDVTATVAD